MKSLLFCMLGLAMTACAPRKAGNVNSGSDELTMLVGTYTDGNSKGIYTFRFNQETGLATSLSSIEVLNPSYLIPSEDGRFVYAVSEMNDATAALNAFSFDKETGKLSLLNRQPTMGADPCYVATNGKEVLTANYSGGSMSIFPLKKNGSLEPVDTLLKAVPADRTLKDRQHPMYIALSSLRMENISLPLTSVPTASCALSYIRRALSPTLLPKPLT